MIIPKLMESADFIPLIDEEFDAVTADLMPEHEWDTITCDEAWDAAAEQH